MDRAQHIAQARAVKALHLADALGRAGCTAAVAREFGESDRRKAEEAARVRLASEETWQVVLAVMDRRERVCREESDAAEAEMFSR